LVLSAGAQFESLQLIFNRPRVRMCARRTISTEEHYEAF
jgi:hypothetical protein